MVFSSFPVYLDPPNWQQRQDRQQQGLVVNENFQLPPLPPANHHFSGAEISIRPTSMSDRARMAKIPQPEGPLKCPRCESTNTKFCYYNNYNLSQPRHFCKTCRRYWTRGGALRNVPVGGGYRRNRKSKRSTPKTSSARGIPLSCPTDFIGHLSQQSQLPIMTSLQNITSVGVGNIGPNGTTSLKLSGLHGQLEDANCVGGQANTGFRAEPDIGGNNCVSTWFYGSLQSESGVEPPMKMEDFGGPTLLGPNGESNQFWGGNSWTNLSSLGSSSTSTTHFL